MGVSGSYISNSGQILMGVSARKIADTIFSVDTASVTFSNLDLDTARQYIIRAFFNDAAESYNLFVNGDTTATNYHTEVLMANGATLSGTGNNNAIITGMNTTAVYSDMNIVKVAGGLPLANSYNSRYYAGGGNMIMSHYSWRYDAATTNVTSITISAVGAAGIKAGSRIALYSL